MGIEGLLLVLAWTATVLTYPVSDYEWNAFKEKFNKTYENGTELAQRRNYEKSKQIVDLCNEFYTKGLNTFSCKINHFADKSIEEIRELYVGTISMTENDIMEGKRHRSKVPKTGLLPPFHDWGAKNAVGPVVNQGGCASSHAIVAANAIESHLFYHKPVKGKRQFHPVSVQQILDCSMYHDGNGKIAVNKGCQGGMVTTAFDYLTKTKMRLVHEHLDPYLKREKMYCKLNRDKKGHRIHGHAVVETGAEDIMAYVVAKTGPLAAVMDASSEFFLFYEQGVYDDTMCRPTYAQGKHSVLIVGYGAKNGKPYWKVKNSWSDDWGMKGYFLLERNKNRCGIANLVSYPLVRKM